MSGTPRTPHRSVRVDDDLWEDARVAAELAGMDRGSAIRQFLRWFVGEPGVELPDRAPVVPDRER